MIIFPTQLPGLNSVTRVEENLSSVFRLFLSLLLILSQVPCHGQKQSMSYNAKSPYYSGGRTNTLNQTHTFTPKKMTHPDLFCWWPILGWRKRDPFNGCKPDLQHLGIKRSRIESPGPNLSVNDHFLSCSLNHQSHDKLRWNNLVFQTSIKTMDGYGSPTTKKKESNERHCWWFRNPANHLGWC